MELEKIGNITINQDISERDLGDEIILITTGRDELHSFKNTGLDIWKMIKEDKSVNEVLDVITREYEIKKEKAAVDLVDFLEDCKVKGFINY